jgi:hypothetical protein
MFWASTALHQEVRCMYVANGTSKMTLSEPGLADSHLRSTISFFLSFFLSLFIYLFIYLHPIDHSNDNGHVKRDITVKFSTWNLKNLTRILL